MHGMNAQAAFKKGVEVSELQSPVEPSSGVAACHRFLRGVTRRYFGSSAQRTKRWRLGTVLVSGSRHVLDSNRAVGMDQVACW